VLAKRIDDWSLITLQQSLAKTGGRPVKHARHYWLAAGRRPSDQADVRAILGKIAALPVPAG
jgi:hypothetical protein